MINTVEKVMFVIFAMILLFSAAVSMPKIEAVIAIAGILTTIYLVIKIRN